MQYNFALAALSTLAIQPFAFPSGGQQDAASFGKYAVHARYNGGFHLDLPSTLMQICHKYNISVPEDVAHAAAASHQRRQLRRRDELQERTNLKHTDVAAIPHYYDAEYLCDVEIGTPPQHFNLNFDSGSSDLWVYGPEMSADKMHGQAQYSPNSSTSASKLEGEYWFAGYIDGGYVGGDVYKDRAAVGGLAVEAQGVQVAKLAFEEITQDAEMDGILGLGFEKLNFARPTRQKTWFANIVPELEEPVFTVDFRHREAGKYTFGYIDSSKLAGPVVYTPVDTREGYWTWTSTGYAIGSGEDATSFRGRKFTGTLDTAKPVLILPTCMVREYYSRVEGARYDEKQGGWVFACDVSLPDFTFGVEEHVVTIPGSYVNTGPVDDDDGGSESGELVGDLAGRVCGGGIQSLGGYVVFGAVAVKAGVVVFDAREGSERLGWANKTLVV